MSGPVIGLLGFIATLVLIAFELPVGIRAVETRPGGATVIQ